MNTRENLDRLYIDVSDNISGAMADILSLNVEHKDGKREIGNITDKLRDIQTRFDSELHQLETQAEWDTFTLAFFGETNAGKSTIIESLRILFKEESRQALLQQHAALGVGDLMDGRVGGAVAVFHRVEVFGHGVSCKCGSA